MVGPHQSARPDSRGGRRMCRSCAAASAELLWFSSRRTRLVPGSTTSQYWPCTCLSFENSSTSGTPVYGTTVYTEPATTRLLTRCSRDRPSVFLCLRAPHPRQPDVPHPVRYSVLAVCACSRIVIINLVSGILCLPRCVTTHSRARVCHRANSQTVLGCKCAGVHSH